MENTIETTYVGNCVLNNGNSEIVVILINFSETDRVVLRHRLIIKLHTYGVTGKIHSRIDDFL